MPDFSEEILLQGHIIDSWALPKVFDKIMDLGGTFDLLQIEVGRRKDQPSFAHLRVLAATEVLVRQIVLALQVYGAELVSSSDVETLPSPGDGLLPDGFYSTTNLPTQVRLNGHWVDVEGAEMDLVIAVDRAAGRAKMLPMGEVERGQRIAVGHDGIRVQPQERSRDRELFAFMSSDVSSEKPKRAVVAEIAREMVQTRARGEKILVVGGPAIIHTGAAPYLASLIRAGYVQVLFGGNAIATHDVESVLYGTSLGVDLQTGQLVPEGHLHHMKAINAVRKAGSLRAMVESGALTSGIMYECVKNNVEFVLAGSVRDDGPLPDVVTDVGEAQRRMRGALPGVGMALMVATMLHSIATGNMLPASVKTVAVDINPAAVTKLADRGTFQALGLVTDAELFLRSLAEALGQALD